MDPHRRFFPPLRIATTASTLTLLVMVSAGASADVLHVPSEYATVGAAALVAFSGDTILVAPDNYAIGRVVLHSGVALLAEGPREDTQLGMGDWEGDGLVLAADGPDTTLVAGFEMLFNSSHGDLGIEVHTPAAIIRGNLFLDLAGIDGGGATILLHDGGIVEKNQFAAGHSFGVFVEGGEALIQYNTWNTDCFARNILTIVPFHDAHATIRNNTFKSTSFDLAEGHAEFVNNLFWGSFFGCGIGDLPEPTISFHHNFFFRWLTYFENCETDTIWGPGNIWWEDYPPGTPLFCNLPGVPCYEETVDSRSPVVGAGENGETLGAWPVNCGPTPVGYDPDPLPPMPSGVGLPAPNPSSGALRLPIAVESGRNATVDIYDAAGRLVRTLRARPGFTAL